MKIVGVILIVLGTLGLLYGGIWYTQREKVVDVGPVQVTREKHNTIPLSPIGGGVAIAAGVVLLASAGRSRA